MTKSLELRWGLIIGGVSTLWLFGAYYLGMHDGGMAANQAGFLVSVMILVMGYMLAIRNLIEKFPETEFREGVRFGALVSGIVAAFAALSQVIYFKLINPDRTADMVEFARQYYIQAGVAEDRATLLAKGAEKDFSLQSFVLQSFLLALIVGMISTSILLLLFRQKRKA